MKKNINLIDNINKNDENILAKNIVNKNTQNTNNKNSINKKTLYNKKLSDNKSNHLEFINNSSDNLTNSINADDDE